MTQITYYGPEANLRTLLREDLEQKGNDAAAATA